MRVCQAAGMFEEMKLKAIEYVDSVETVDAEGMELFSIAFKSVLSPRRRAWRAFKHEEAANMEKGQDRLHFLVGEQREKLEGEILSICAQLLALVGRLLSVKGDSEGADGRVLYLKLRGDASRYMSEIYESRGDRQLHTESVMNAKAAYEAASVLARNLPPVDPTGLGLAVNFSLFTFHVLKRPHDACVIAKDAYARAALVLGPTSSASDQVRTGMQTLRDNLVLWTCSRSV
jgi:hypothetical protein